VTTTRTALDDAALRQELAHHLDGRWGEVRAKARELAADPRFQPSTSTQIEDQRARVTEQLQTLADLGEPRMGFPSEFGGRDDLGGSITAFEMLAMGDLSLLVKAGVQFGLFGGAVLHLGTQRHHERYLEQIQSLELPGCFAMTETGHGSDVASILTTATYDPATQEFDLHSPVAAATKDYIGNAARDGKAAAVFAQLVTHGKSEGVHAFFVPIRDDDGNALPGVTITDDGLKAGLNGVDNGRLRFDHVRVPRENLLNRYGDVAPDGTYSTPIENQNRRFFTMLGTLIQGRISVGGGAGSATKVALTIALRYGDARRQFGAPGSDDEIVVNDYLVHQRKLLVPLAKTFALHFAQSELVETLHEVFTSEAFDSPKRRELETRAAGTKAFSTWHATHTIQTCREACGGQGYLVENRLPVLKADTDVFTTFEGDNTVLLQLVAKELLSGYASDFGDMSTVTRAGFLAEQVGEVVLEKLSARKVLSSLLSATPGRDDEADLHDRDWQVGLLGWREKHMLDSVAKRLRRALGADDPFPIFNAAQDHMLALAKAHVERVLLESFVRGVDSCADPAARALLDRVCDLFALSTIEADRAWFMEHGRLTARQSKAVTAEVNGLLGELRPDAVLLVEAFGVPEAAVAAPIAQGAEADRQREARAARESSGTSLATEEHEAVTG
jgi:acyl-CoA oxidase